MGKRPKNNPSKPAKKSVPVTPTTPLADPWITLVLAWLVPGLGHAFLGRRGRGMVFFAIILSSLLIGVWIDGRLPWHFGGSPLAVLATLGALGSGLPCILLRFAFGYEGDMTAAGFEYGGAFILSAGLMNLLLVLDAWDIVWGKELERPEVEEEPAS